MWGVVGVVIASVKAGKAQDHRTYKLFVYAYMISLTTGIHHVVFKRRNVVWYFDIKMCISWNINQYIISGESVRLVSILLHVWQWKLSS